MIRNELIKYLDQPLNFSKHMNQALKFYVESNKHDTLNHFEQSVHYINKRHNQNHSSPSKEVLHIQQQQQEVIAHLHEETRSLQNENKHLKLQIDEIRDELHNLGSTNMRLKQSQKKQTCTVI